MAGFVINDTSYAGTWETEAYILPSMYQMDTIEKGVAWIKSGIKKKHTIGKLNLLNPLQPRVATPTIPSGPSLTVDARVLDPQDAMAFVTLNPRDLEDHWEAQNLSETLLARQLPNTIESYFIMLMLTRAGEGLETGLHQGSKAYYGQVDVDDVRYAYQFFDGFIRKLILDGTYIEVPTPSAITSSNIIAKFDSALSTLATVKQGKAMLSKSGRYKYLKYLVSVEDFQLFQEATKTLTFKGGDVTTPGVTTYRGYQVVPLAGLPKDTFYFCHADGTFESNLIVGLNSFDDMNIELGKVYNYSEEYFAKALFKMDTQIAKPNELVLHTTKVAADFLP